MDRLPPILALLALLAVCFGSLAGCGSTKTMVLDSDIPNVSGYEPIITRDIEHADGMVSAIEVIYRGDVSDTRKNITETRAVFVEHGWSVVSEQSRGKTTIMNFSKPPRWASVQIALNQIDPMMSPALLRVGTGGSAQQAVDAPSPDRLIGPPGGFAPPPYP
ncbi:MAG: hypothetical protein EXS03_03525 [Phycisphaerales bacterium]|nr:hypothetical protein [Phycisphaerales bacterium]